MPSGAVPHKPAAPAASPAVPAVFQQGALSGLEDGARQIILRQMQTLALRTGDVAFRPGDACSNYILVKQGAIKVLVTTESGREIVLYRVQEGETCVLTAACLMARADYDAEAIAEQDSELVILPRAAFDELLAMSPRFRQFVFTSFGGRLQALIGLIQEITVRHMDRKLARHLLRIAQGGVIEATHQAIANELNTAREVVTRLLNDFAERGWLELSRARIVLRDERSLDAFADQV